MCEEINKRFNLHPKVREAMESIEREVFVPAPFKHFAYTLNALSMQAQQYISSPLTVAKMTQYLEIDHVDSVLEIGCGSGYQAAVLSQIFRRVFSIERIESLYLEARLRLKTLGLGNVHVKFADGIRAGINTPPMIGFCSLLALKISLKRLLISLKKAGY